MKQKILIATTNTGKFNEIMEVLDEASIYFEFLSLKDVDIKDQPKEDGDSYLANARIKAEFYNALSGLPTIAEDSGIEVEALKGKLGMHTRRWGAGENASDETWVEYFLKTMAEHEDKRASFKCTAFYIDKSGISHHFQGECRGVITGTVEAPILAGIPLSSCFKAHTCDKVYAALQNEEKNKLSHRGKAMKKLLEHLQSNTISI
ncbi:MAG: non-canonical purine NTP pyrophosphatase [Candidatus Peregrinibacteria bacterium]|nr:non-canonical purine NTP pyrophosphatase [Candidatus Peregrinibacteria bacterium]